MSSTVTVSLDRLGPAPPADDRYRGRVIHLPGRGMVVVVKSRSAGGWRCAVIGRRASVTGRGHVVVSVAEMDTAETAVAVDSDRDPDGLAMTWQALVWCKGFGGRNWVLARALVERAMDDATARVVLTPEACVRVMRAANVGPYSLRITLTRLVTDGFLVPVPDGDKGGTETYELTIPGNAAAAAHE